MRLKTELKSIAATLILAFYVIVCLVLSVFVTQFIFRHGAWLAWFIVYIVTLAAIAQGIKEHKIDQAVTHWLEQRFGVKV